VVNGWPALDRNIQGGFSVYIGMKPGLKSFWIGLVIGLVITLAVALLMQGCSFYRGIDSGTRTYGISTNDPYKY
jgi:hypothetical protein